MRWLDGQLTEEQADLVVCPTGTGALVQAAVNHLNTPEREPAVVIAVDPDTDPSFWKRLAREESPGGNANGEALFEAPWSVSKPGIEASVSVSDYKLIWQALTYKPLGLNESSVLVIICSEGLSPYTTPKDVSSDDVMAQTLVQIDSSDPDFGSTPRHGEAAIANYITA